MTTRLVNDLQSLSFDLRMLSKKIDNIAKGIGKPRKAEPKIILKKSGAKHSPGPAAGATSPKRQQHTEAPIETGDVSETVIEAGVA